MTIRPKKWSSTNPTTRSDRTGPGPAAKSGLSPNSRTTGRNEEEGAEQQVGRRARFCGHADHSAAGAGCACTEARNASRPAKPALVGTTTCPTRRAASRCASGAPWQAQVYYPNTAAAVVREARAGHAVVAVAALLRRHADCSGLGAHGGALHRRGHGQGRLSRPPRRAGHLEGRWLDLQDRPDRAAFAVRLEDTPGAPNMYANDIALIHIVEDLRQPPRDPARVRAIPLYERPFPRGRK